MSQDKDVKGFASAVADLIQSPKYQELESKRANFWHVLEYGQHSIEVRYSRMLRWLLDPNETVTLEVLVQPAGGTVTLNNDGSFTYVPNAGFFGVDTFEYQLNSTVLLNGEFSDTAIVTIKVTPKQIFLPLILR